MLVSLNGQLVPAERAQVSAFDRGFIFGDGVYEGLRAVRLAPGASGHVIGMNRHIRRLAEGLAACRIEWDARQLGPLTHELLAANELADAFIYWQVTRGTPPIIDGRPVRSRVPVAGVALQPTVFGYCLPHAGLEKDETQGPALKRISLRPDERWHLGHIKSTSLLGNIIASMSGAAAAGNEGVDETVLVRNGLITEGTYSNVAFVLPCHRSRASDFDAPARTTPEHQYEVVTPSLDAAPILNGITRQILLELEPSIVQRAVRVEEVAQAREIMLWGTTTMVSSVTHVDGKAVDTGPVARRLNDLLLKNIRQGTDHSENV
ncbi:MAG: aminotransferase class IV [Phycisphaerales bacterium]